MRASENSGESWSMGLSKSVRPFRGRGPGSSGGGEGSDKRPEVKSFEYWWYCIAKPGNNIGEGATQQVAWEVEFIYECEISMTTQLDRPAQFRDVASRSP